MTLRLSLAFLLLGFCDLSAEAANRIVAQSGQAAPGTSGQFSQFFISADGPSAPVLNDAGRVAFSATLTNSPGGVTSLNDTGIWSEGSGALSLVAREGHAAPGPAGALFRRAAYPVINSAGAVAFAGLLRENVAGVTLDSNSGIWSNVGGSLQLIAREGTQAVGTPAGVDFATLIDPALSDAGQTAFRGTLRGTGVDTTNQAGVWAQKNGFLEIVARAGSPAPGTAVGVNFKSFSNGLPSINAVGNITFRAFLTTANDTDMGVWVKRGDVVSLVVREKHPISGVGSEILNELPRDPVLNAAGQTAFIASVFGIGGGHAIVVENDTPTIIVRKGNVDPGSLQSATFGNFSSVLLNDDGNIAFQGLIEGTNVLDHNNEGIWVEKNGDIQRIAVEGMQAPGAASNTLFGSFSNLAFNNAGQVAFVASLTGSGVSEANNLGIWASTPAGELRLIAQEGTPFGGGDLSGINGLHFAGGSAGNDGQRSGFNDRGELAYLATYASGANRVIVSDAAALSPGDFDGNGTVDGGDFLAWQRGFGKTTGALPQHGDANRDGDVDSADLASWKSTFNGAATSAATSAVPEPAAGALICIAAMTVLTSARRPARTG